MASIADVFFRAVLDDKDLQIQAVRAGDKAGQSLGQRISDGFSKVGKNLQQTGAALTRNVTAPILGLGAAVVSVGTEFDTTLRQIVALTDVTQDEIGGVRDRLLELGPALGKSPQELAEGFYFLASAGFTTAEALEVLETTAKASAAGLGTTADISKVIGAAINAFGKESLTAADATDQLIRAINKGTAEAPEFAGALGNVLGTAAQVGATFGDTTAAIAGMTLAGIGTEEATTSLNQVLLSLLKTTPQAEEALKDVGLSAEGLREQLREKGLLSVLQTLTERFAGNETAAAAAFGNVRALRGVLALTGLDAAQLADVFESVNNGTQNLSDAFAETEGPGREMGRAMAEIQVALIELADDVMPQFLGVLKTVVGFIHTGVEAFKALPQPVRAGIVQVAGFAAALGPLLFISGKVVSGIGGIVRSFRTLLGVGQALAPVIAKVISGLASSSIVSGATDTAGKLLGGRFGAALKLGLLAAAAGIILELWNDLQKQMDERAGQFKAIGAAIAEQITTGTREQLEQSKASLEQGIADIGIMDFFVGGPGGSSPAQQLQAELDKVNATLAAFPPEAAKTLEAGAPTVEAGAKAGLIAPLVDAALKATKEADKAGREAVGAYANALRGGWDSVQNAWDSLKTAMKDPMSRAKRIAELEGILTSKKLAKGLRSNDPLIRADAEALVLEIEDELRLLKEDGKKHGKAGGEGLADGLTATKGDVRSAARAMVRAASEVARDLNLRDEGRNAGLDFAAGLRSAVAAAARAAAALAAIVAQYLQFGSPTELGPFSEDGGPEGWGQIGAKDWVGGWDVDPRGTVSALAGRAAAALQAPFQSPVVGMAASAGFAALAPSGTGGLTVNGGIHLHGIGSDVSPQRARDFGQQVLDEVAGGLRSQTARLPTGPRS